MGEPAIGTAVFIWGITTHARWSKRRFRSLATDRYKQGITSKILLASKFRPPINPSIYTNRKLFILKSWQYGIV